VSPGTTVEERSNGEVAVRPPASLGLRLAHVFGVQDAGRLLRDFATYLPSHVVPAVVGFLVLPILARRLAPTELGVLALAQTAITFGWIAAGSWLTASIVRELAGHRQRGEQELFRRTLARGLALVAAGLAGFAALVGLASTVSSAIGENALLIVAATAGLIVENVTAALFTASFRPRAYGVVELAARVGSIGFGTILVFEGYGVRGYLVGLATGSLAVGLVGLVAAWPRDGRARTASPSPTPAVRPWLHYGIPASTAAIVLWGLTFVDRYLLAGLANAGEVGIYTLGSVLGDKVVMVPMYAFFVAATPLLVAAFEQHGHAEAERLMRSYTRLILLLGLPCIAAIGVAADELVPLLAGEPYKEFYAPADRIPAIIAIGSLLYALTTIGGIPLSLARRTRPLVYASAIGLAANVAANLALIPSLDALGAAIATPLGWLVYLGAVRFWARRHGRWHFPAGTLVRAGAAAGVGYAAAVLLVPETRTEIAGVFAETVVVAVVYLAALFASGELGRLRARTSA
jgi:O-antigen/teichoic acid export membrane protein